MAKIRIEVNSAGVEQMLRGQGEFSKVREDLVRRAEKIAAKAGAGFEVEEFQGHDRLHVQVRSATEDAMRAEATGHALSRAIDAGR